MKYSGKVLRDEEKNPGSKSTRNLYAVDNVNVAQGPRTGNRGTPAKRGEFKAAKEERAPLADTITAAYGARAERDFIDYRHAEGIAPIVKPKKFSR
mgnify:CR=1 FL=1